MIDSCKKEFDSSKNRKILSRAYKKVLYQQATDRYASIAMKSREHRNSSRQLKETGKTVWLLIAKKSSVFPSYQQLSGLHDPELKDAIQ
jgi:hypothetical protein